MDGMMAMKERSRIRKALQTREDPKQIAGFRQRLEDKYKGLDMYLQLFQACFFCIQSFSV
jgi:hypothetical protein